jgi:hypothetical protein
MAALVRTETVLDADELAEVIGQAPGADETIIAVCAGEWRKDKDGRWRVWADPDWEEDEDVDQV